MCPYPEEAAEEASDNAAEASRKAELRRKHDAEIASANQMLVFHMTTYLQKDHEDCPKFVVSKEQCKLGLGLHLVVGPAPGPPQAHARYRDARHRQLAHHALLALEDVAGWEDCGLRVAQGGRCLHLRAHW